MYLLKYWFRIVFNQKKLQTAAKKKNETLILDLFLLKKGCVFCIIWHKKKKTGNVLVES